MAFNYELIAECSILPETDSTVLLITYANGSQEGFRVPNLNFTAADDKTFKDWAKVIEDIIDDQV